MTTPEDETRERRDWTLLIFIIPIGIILMLIAGQIAIRLVPSWTVNAGMQSNLDPANLPPQQAVQPLLPGILTPLSWLDTFLTPGTDGYEIISEFIVLNPSTSIPTNIPPVTGTGIPATVISQSTATISNPPATRTAVPATVISQPTATISNPPVVTATSTPTQFVVVYTNTPTNTPISVNTDTPTNTPTSTLTNTPTNTPTYTPTATPTGFPSTPDSTWTQDIINVDVGNPDGTTITNIAPGHYAVIDITSSPIIIIGSLETNYDLVYNEVEFPAGSSQIYLDSVILGISTFADGHVFFDVFNWGNGIPDLNTNIWNVVDVDNQIIPMANLWNYPGTGILIDADNAPSLPPPQSYGYLVIACPATAPQSLQVDSVMTFP